MSAGIRILYCDHHLIAVDKPAGLATQAPSPFESMESQVKEYIKTTFAKPGGVYLGIPHRLDRPVSGVILFCRNSKAAARVARQFQEHAVQKTYRAVLKGEVPNDEFEWHDYLRKVEGEARGEVTSPDQPGAKEAVTLGRVTARSSGKSWVILRPRTGRMHQLRIQSAVRGFPILGDRLYDAPAPPMPGTPESTETTVPADAGATAVPTAPSASSDPRGGRIALHALSLVLEHPFRKTELRIEADPPADFDAWSP